MKTRQEAFIEALTEVYENMDCSRMRNEAVLHLEVHLGHTDPCCYKGKDALGVLVKTKRGMGAWPDVLARVSYDPPRVAPPKGTPVLVWDHSKEHAVLGISTGELYHVGDGREQLKVTINGSKSYAGYFEWSVLVEADCRGGM